MFVVQIECRLRWLELGQREFHVVIQPAGAFPCPIHPFIHVYKVYTPILASPCWICLVEALPRSQGLDGREMSQIRLALPSFQRMEVSWMDHRAAEGAISDDEEAEIFYSEMHLHHVLCRSRA